MRFLREGYVHCSSAFLVKNCVFLIIFLLRHGYCDDKYKNEIIHKNKPFNVNYCTRGISYINETSDVVYWNSKGIENEIVVSAPPCTDKDGNLITRMCRNHTWVPHSTNTQCIRSTRYGRRCPINFEETPDSCIFIASPRPWENICSFDVLSQNSDSTPLGNELLWLPYKRLKKYGHYESLTFGEKFGVPFSKPLNASLTDDDFFQKDCLVVNISSEEYYPENCNKEHRYICEFSKNEANSRCPDGCVSANIVTGSCYCKQTEYCPILGVVNNIFDLTVLKNLADDDLCYVSGTNIPEYPLSGLKQALTDDIWMYTDKHLNCYLCLTQELRSSSSGDVEMVLYFDEKAKALYLTIYSPKNLFDNASEKTIYCYTNAAPYELKKREKVEKILENTQSTRPYNVYEVNLEEFIGTYHCEAFKNIDNEDDKVFSNHVLAYKNKNGNEFAVRIVIKSICVLFPCNKNYAFQFDNIIDEALEDLKSEIRVMDIYTFDFESLDLLLHVSPESKVGDILDEYNYIKKQLEQKQNNQELDIIYIRSSEFCLPEEFNNLTWPLTQLDQGAVSIEHCLQESGLPVVRFCGGRFLTGAEWNEVLGDCAKDVEIPESTKYIYSTLNQSITDETINNVTDIINNDPNLPVLSIYYATKFLDKIFTELNTSLYNSIDSTINITDSLLNVNKEFLVFSQELLNVTDDLIDLVDNILTETPLTSDVLVVKRNNVIIHVTNPILSGVSGLVVYKDEGNEPSVVNLPRNSTFDDLGPNVVIALIIPEDILNHRNGSNITIISTIYLKDAFFESNYTKKPAGPVVSITIPEFGGYLPSPVPILFQVTNYSDTPECGFWDYGKKTVRKKGQWSTVGGTYLGEYNNQTNYHICSYSHLTHFSLLRLTLEDSLSETDDAAIDIITLIGDVLSIFGIAGIFITAALFKRWRRKQGTIILLNLSVSILLEIILLQITDSKFAFIPNVCSVFGILMHYIVICKFCWMLVYSFLQYMRFVKVLMILPENIVLKSTIFGWGFAVIPVAIVNIVNATAYTNKKYNFCYPVGLYLYLGVLFPVCLIILINTFVFFAVMREVTSKTVESHGSKENVQKLQLQLAFLLFFVLGVPWMFWIFASLIQITSLKLTFIYLFYVTSNIQGFILFLFYVVFNSETRQAWLKYFNKTRPKSFSISTKTISRS